jgi:hypothetical protein
MVPAEAAAAGVKWSPYSGTNWYDSGYVAAMETGVYSITFSQVDGWDLPAIDNVAVQTGNEVVIASGEDNDNDGMSNDWEIRNCGSGFISGQKTPTVFFLTSGIPFAIHCPLQEKTRFLLEILPNHSKIRRLRVYRPDRKGHPDRESPVNG